MLSRPFQNRYWRLRVDLKLSLCLHAWLKATELASWHPRPAGQLRAGARYWQDRIGSAGLPSQHTAAACGNCSGLNPTYRENRLFRDVSAILLLGLCLV